MQRYLSFNTSHVTLYHLCLRTAMVIITFQYISCYSLSWSVRRRQYHLCPFQYISCYSLSYHKRIGRYVVTGFQYISCYSLSNLLIMKRYCKNMFQYISCYSLSMTSKHYKYFQPKFQYISCYSLSRKYPWGNQREIGVSIHLMLLFIEDELSKIADSGRFNTSHVTLYRYIRGIIIVILWFQYISCYSLSVWSSLSFLKWFVSIHLMLLFIKLHLW